jgi:transposase
MGSPQVPAAPAGPFNCATAIVNPMTTPDDIAAHVKRLYHAEQWPIGTIAMTLGIHHSAVQRILDQENASKARSPRPSMIDPYVPFIVATLEKYPQLTASRVYHMLRERGYPGSESHFRSLIAPYRPRPAAAAFLRLRTLPGEQGQVDWAAFGQIEIGKAKRPLMGFVMVLSYSRKIFLRFCLDARMANFLGAHRAAFDAFVGVPRVLLYDNLKSAVIQREGAAIRFNPEILKFAGHYRYEPRPVAVARGNQKGRVERAIRYIRDSFFAGRRFTDLADLNAQAETWCQGIATDRPCPEDRSLTVGAAFRQEQGSLMALPDAPYPTEERIEVRAGKTPYIRFDSNDYAIPHTHVQRTLTVFADHQRVRITDGPKLLATHARSDDRGAPIEDDAPRQRLLEAKQNARQHRSTDRLRKALPSAQDFLGQAAARGYSLTAVLRQLTELLERHRREDLELALQDALNRRAPHPNAVRLALEARLEREDRPPPVALPLSPVARSRDVTVTPHDLKDYEQLTEEASDEPA